MSGPDEFDALVCDRPIHGDNPAVALDLARRGFPVFPIRDWSDGDGWKPIKRFQEQATSDCDTVAAWWARWPDARVGLLTGERSGVSVLDLDVKGGKDGVAALAALGFDDLEALSPVRTRTPSGGWHLYFRYDARLLNSVSKIGPGIDVKTAGGLVIAPGSLKNGERYNPEGAPLGSIELPPFPEALIPAREPEREPVPLAVASEELCEWATGRLAKLTAELASMPPESGRNDFLNSAAMWAGGAAAHGFLDRDGTHGKLWEAANAAGMRKREFEATFKSGFSKGLKKPISEFPRGTTADEFDDLDELDEADDTPPTKAKQSRLTFMSPGACADAPSRGYVIKGLVAPGDVGCIYGAPGAGKSLISPHLGYAVVQGRSAFGMRTKPGRVFYVAAEDPHGMRGRVSALRLRHGDAGDFTLVEGVSDLLSVGSEDLVALYAAVKEQAPALLFIDTLAMAFPGLEENSADAMGRVVAVARKLASKGTAVVLIHHDTKAGSPTPRGHSLLNGALDVALQLLARDEHGIVRGKLSKNRNGACDRDFAFRIATEMMGKDEDGDAVTVALVDELAPITGPKRPKLTPSERAALDILADMFEASERRPVSEDDWRQACIDARTVSAADDRDSRRRATKRAFEGLARKSAVRIRDDGVIIPDIASCPGAADDLYQDDLDA